MHQIEGKQKHQRKGNYASHAAMVAALICASTLWNSYVHMHVNDKKIVAQGISAESEIGIPLSPMPDSFPFKFP